MAWNQANHNFGEVQPGRIYRSGQMPASALAQTIRERQIKTVLNLRGSNPSERWYRDELATTREAGATHVDIAMSSCLWMSRAQLRALVEDPRYGRVPAADPLPWGSERTGLVSAFAELLRPGGTLDDARAQFSIRYLFVRVNDGKVMAEHLDQYESWLRESGVEHTSGQLSPLGRRGISARSAQSRGMAVRPLSPGRGHSARATSLSRSPSAERAGSNSSAGMR